MTKVDILYLSWNRIEFTRASLKALRENTDWSLVNRIHFYDDGSTDGAGDLVMREVLVSKVRASGVGTSHLGGPVAVMNDYLRKTADEKPAPIFVKIDNDVMLPPCWLNEALATMDANSSVDLLGIEPGVGPNPNATQANIYADYVREALPCDFIGGIGLMRRRAFEGRELPTAAGRFGFGHWQEKHADVKKAWIAPGLCVFLLNRLPFEPWASLSDEYVRKGWQRDWPEPYTEADAHVWRWWENFL